MYQKFSFFFCSSIKEPDQYDYYADTKPVLYNGIGDLYTVSKNNLGAKIQTLYFLSRPNYFVIFANFVKEMVKKSVKSPERNCPRSRNLYIYFAGTAERSYHCEHYRLCSGRFGHFDAVYPQMWLIP